MNKQERKALIAKYKEDQQKKFEASLPMTKNEFTKLFDYLDRHCSDCKNDFTWTERYLSERKLPLKEVLEWLRDNGADCDCEVLLNVEEKFW